MYVPGSLGWVRPTFSSRLTEQWGDEKDLSCATRTMPQRILIHAPNDLNWKPDMNVDKQNFSTLKEYVRAIERTKVQNCLNVLQPLEGSSAV